jgi:hypothetical protein
MTNEQLEKAQELKRRIDAKKGLRADLEKIEESSFRGMDVWYGSSSESRINFCDASEIMNECMIDMISSAIRKIDKEIKALEKEFEKI